MIFFTKASLGDLVKNGSLFIFEPPLPVQSMRGFSTHYADYHEA